MAETDANVFAMHFQRITLSKRTTQNNAYLNLKSDGSLITHRCVTLHNSTEIADYIF